MGVKQIEAYRKLISQRVFHSVLIQSITATRKKQKIINEIILPRVKYVREELKLSSNFPALLVMDVFRGQMTKAVHNLLKDHNIFMSLVPNGMTHIFQLLDPTVNSWAKKFMKEKYAAWYALQIQAGLEKGLAVDEIDVKTPLITMKPLHAKWIMNLYDEITSEKGKEIVLNGWKAAGILDAVKMGSAKLKCLDPFNDIDPLGGDSISFEDDIQFPKEGNLNVNERCESDSDDEYVLHDERYVFDAIAV